MVNLRFDNRFRISILRNTNREIIFPYLITIIRYTIVDSASSNFRLRNDLFSFLTPEFSNNWIRSTNGSDHSTKSSVMVFECITVKQAQFVPDTKRYVPGDFASLCCVVIRKAVEYRQLKGQIRQWNFLDDCFYWPLWYAEQTSKT